MDARWLAVLIPAMISVMLEKGPAKLRAWWSQVIEKDWKPTVMLVGCILIALLAVGAACAGVDLGLGAACHNPRDPQLWVETIGIGFVAWLITQGLYMAANPSKASPPLLNVEESSGSISVTATMPTDELAPAPMQIGVSPIGPGALARGVQVETLMSADLIPFHLYPDPDLDRMEQAIREIRDQRRGTVVG